MQEEDVKAGSEVIPLAHSEVQFPAQIKALLLLEVEKNQITNKVL